MKPLFFLLSFFPLVVLAQTRQPISNSLDLPSSTIFGGAIEAALSVSPPDPYTPSLLNGVAESGDADLRLKVRLRYLAAGQLGSRNAGEFVPYQKVTVRIENLSTLDPNNFVEFDLAPAVSATEGWHYASEVRLPPVDSVDDLLSDEFRFSVVSISLSSVALHFDAQPPSKLFRPLSETDTSLLFDDLVDLSLARSLRQGLLLPPRGGQNVPFWVWGFFPAFLLGRKTLRTRKYAHPKKSLSNWVPTGMTLAFLLGSCEVEPLVSSFPTFTQLVLIKDQPISGGAMLATVSFEKTDVIDFPTEEAAAFPGGNENIKAEESNLYLQLDVRYSGALQGGQKAGDFVPYLLARAELTNLDNDQKISFFLTPHMSLVRGYHYGRNVRVATDVGLSASGYSLSIEINPPALLTDAALPTEELGRSSISPGIVIGSDFSPFVAGTLFSLSPLGERAAEKITLQREFTLSDFNEDAP